jgi:mannose-1-phosphate guanylyltransferase
MSVKGIILAAGFGTRLRPLTDKVPKPLLHVGGQPMIQYSLLLLRKYGITDVVINLHCHAEQIIEAIGDGRQFGMKIDYSEETDILGTGGGIRKIASDFSHETSIVINGDIVIDIDLSKLIRFHLENQGAATLVLREAEAGDGFGRLEIDATHRIRNILGRLRWKSALKQQFMFTGLHLINRPVLDYIPEGQAYSIIDAYLEMLKENKKLCAFITTGYWNDLGHIDRYHSVDRALKEGTLQLKIN